MESVQLAAASSGKEGAAGETAEGESGNGRGGARPGPAVDGGEAASVPGADENLTWFRPAHPVVRDDDPAILQEQVRRAYDGHPTEMLWAMAVTCALLNRTRRVQTATILAEVLDVADPRSITEDEDTQCLVREALRPTGMCNRKLTLLQMISRSVLEGAPYDRIRGSGDYFRQSWEMVALGRFKPKVLVTDPYLRQYWIDKRGGDRWP